MKFKYHVYTDSRGLVSRGESTIDGRALLLSLIEEHKLGFDDKIRIARNDVSEFSADAKWYRVIGASVNGEKVDYVKIDLHKENSMLLY